MISMRLFQSSWNGTSNWQDYVTHSNSVDCKRKTIIKDISEIKFCQMKEIAILRNNIESVEQLSRIWMPVLANINIGKPTLIH